MNRRAFLTTYGAPSESAWARHYTNTVLTSFLAPKPGIGNTNPSRQLEFVTRVRF